MLVLGRTVLKVESIRRRTEEKVGEVGSRKSLRLLGDYTLDVFILDQPITDEIGPKLDLAKFALSLNHHSHRGTTNIRGGYPVGDVVCHCQQAAIICTTGLRLNEAVSKKTSSRKQNLSLEYFC